MKLAIMQPYIFPYIGYYQLINAVDKFVVLDDVNFIMRGWINRNRIVVNGEEHLFTIPLKKASQNKLIHDIELADNKWKEKLLKTIELSYKDAPFFMDCYKIVSSIFTNDEVNLSRWIHSHIKTVCNYLQITTEIVETSRIYSNRHLKAQDKIIDICKQEKADIYLNAIGGKSIYSPADFKINKIDLRFLNTLSENYPQKSVVFMPFLSIIDVMMHNNVNDIRTMLNKYELL